MSLNFKILGGTPKSGKSLCVSCAQVSRRIGQNGEDEVWCGSYGFSDTGATRVMFRVAECSQYRPFNQQDLKDMYETAWKVEARRKGPAGFAAGSKEEAEEGEMVITITPPKKSKDED